jgi:hypothetical protein
MFMCHLKDLSESKFLEQYFLHILENKNLLGTWKLTDEKY